MHPSPPSKARWQQSGLGSNKVQIVLEDSSGNPSQQVILNGLIQYNVSKTEGRFAPPFFSFVQAVKDDHGQTIGGLTAKITYGWLHIDLLHLPESSRGQGIGSQLMAHAEAVARDKRCIGIPLDTMSFQAPEFYATLGYIEYGRLDDYPPGHTRYFLHKRLG
jgi:GNAT superfamily N-acetyltransferase